MQETNLCPKPPSPHGRICSPKNSLGLQNQKLKQYTSFTMLSTSPLSSSLSFPATINHNNNGGKSRLKSIKINFTPKMSLEPSSSPLSNPNLINSLTKLLWGKSLPPQLLISTVRSTWNTVWLLMMSQLAPSDSSGSYTRPTSQFRVNPINGNAISMSNELHLYVGLPCPWAHRTLIVRALKGLENNVPVSIASPGIDGAWVFIDSGDKYKGSGGLVPGLDNVNGCKTLKEVYQLRRDGYNGRATVPMLWDLEKKDVVCNESYDILELFNSGLNGLASNPDMDLSPAALKERIDEWNRIIYPKVNNGVYRCGFAQSQEAYDMAANELFSTFDMIDDHLGNCRYLCGETLTLADICLFTTLIRFDLVYNVMFKCTKKKIIEYPNLHGYMRDIYQIPKVADTCNFRATMDGYYKFLFPLNPGGIRPIMPASCGHDEILSSAPHNRDLLSSSC